MKAPPPPAVAVYNWTGFYIGGNVGYSWGKADTTLFEVFNISPKPNGIIGGVQIGYSWQVAPNFVFGIEADFQGSGQKGSDTASAEFFLTAPILVTLTHTEKITWFGTVRGRIGYTFLNNETMLYATGGLAYAQVKNSGIFTTAPDRSSSFSESQTKAGWTVGGGIEGALFNARNWTWKVEYLYIDLGTIQSVPTLSFTFEGDLRSKVTDNIVRFGINYRFGGAQY